MLQLSTLLYRNSIDAADDDDAVEPTEDAIDTVEILEDARCGSAGAKAVGGDGGTTHTAESSELVGVEARSHIAPISDMGIVVLFSSALRLFSLKA